MAARRPTAEPRKRVRRSAEEARRVILDAAEKRLREGGPEALRLQDIAGDVGISHPAILHHFESRDGLIDALEERAMARLEAELVEILREAPANEDTVVGLLERVFATLGDAGHARVLAWRVLGLDRPGPDEGGQKLLRAVAGLVHDRRRSIAERAGGPAPRREESEFQVRLAAIAMLGEGIFGPFIDADLGRSDDGDYQRRFRAWFAHQLMESGGGDG